MSGDFNPLDFGNRLSSGTTTSSRIKSEVTEARRDNLFLISGAWKPGVTVSTMKPLISSPVFAHTIAMSDTLPFVIHLFVPLSTQPLPVRRARVSRSEEHTSELQSLRHLVCRLLLEKK